MRNLPVLLLSALAAPCLCAQAGAGDLLVSPARVILDNKTRSVELILSNRGGAASTYRIRLVHMAMTVDGGIEAATAPASGLDPAELVRYAPHQVTLEPGQTQVLRVMVRKPADLPDGEYRVHMLFQAVPPDLAGTAEPSKEKAKGVSIRLIAIMNLGIPIIIRQGELVAKTGLADLHLQHEQDQDVLAFRLTRTGNASTYGNLKATFQPRMGKSVTVGEMVGVAVYPPLEARNVKMVLYLPQGVALKTGTLHLSFQTEDKGIPEAEVQLEIP